MKFVNVRSIDNVSVAVPAAVVSSLPWAHFDRIDGWQAEAAASTLLQVPDAFVVRR